MALALTLTGALALGAVAPQDVPPRPPDPDSLAVSYRKGDYEACRDAADRALEGGSRIAPWFVWKIRAHLALGEVGAARATADRALALDRGDLELRLVASEAYRRADLEASANSALADIDRLVSRQAWNYDSPQDRVVLGRAALLRGADPKQVMADLYAPAKRDAPKRAEVHVAIGELALDKEDFEFAAEALHDAEDLEPDDPEIQYLLSRAFRSSDPERSSEHLERALALNPRHAPSLLEVADRLLAEERYDEAEQTLRELLSTDHCRYEAWASRAAIAHLRGDFEQEAEYRANAFDPWARNPGVDHWIGRELSEHYRFAEGAAAQRRALQIDPKHRPARFQLAQDLLRTGEEEEGWKLAVEVADEDPYHVVAYNLATLMERLREYRTIEADGFRVRMRAEEAEVFGDEVLALLHEADRRLTAKYSVELERPIVVELFDQQKDFAIRTFGLPGGDGYLGVCFGRLITMNSPSSQGEQPSNWRAVLWHEFTHVVTLQKTANRMPRWLSEGISVHEEMQLDPTFGRPLIPRRRAFVLAGRTIPVSALSSAFLRPQGPEGLDFAYFEAGEVVRYLVETYGHDTLCAVLDDLRAGIPLHVSFESRFAPAEELDAAFAADLERRARSGNGSYETLERSGAESTEDLYALLGEHPDHVPLLLDLGRQLLAEDRGSEAATVLERCVALDPTVQEAHAALARIAVDSGRPERELAVYERWSKTDADALPMRLRWMELLEERGDFAAEREVGRQALAVQPMLAELHRRLLRAAESVGDPAGVLPHARALAALGTDDLAQLHLDVAKARFALGDLDGARIAVLEAIAEAPRFKAALALLLEIDAARRGGGGPPERRP